jgi:hypothetical protein
MKTKTNKTIGDEMAEQMRSTGSIFTLLMTADCDGCESVILKDNDCGDITIIQDYGEGPKVTHIDPEQVEAIKSILK